MLFLYEVRVKRDQMGSKMDLKGLEIDLKGQVGEDILVWSGLC